MASYLGYLNFINLPVRKSYTVNERTNPFSELDDDEFQKHFHVMKPTAVLLLFKVNCHSTRAMLYYKL